MSRKLAILAVFCCALLNPFVALRADSISHGFIHDYNQRINKTIIRPGVSLNTINGFQQPIKLGVRDYVFQGDLKDINKFLKSKGEYKIIAQTLNADGHWVDGGERNVYMVVVNKGKSASEELFSYLMGSLVSVVVGGTTNALPEAKSILASLDLSELQGGGAGLVDEIGNIMDLDSAREKVSELYNVLKKRFKESHASKRNDKANTVLDVSGGERVDYGKRLIVTLTAYPAPSTSARAVVDMGHSEISVAHLADALKILGASCKHSKKKKK